MNIEKLIERLRTESLYKDKATLEIMDLCMEAADALSTLQAENKELRAEAEGMRSNWYKSVEGVKKLRAELEQVKRERDAGVLLACAHCGKQAYISVDYECEPDSMGRKWAYTVVCGTCCATSGLCFSPEMASLAWNTRTPILSESELKKLEENT